MKVCFRPGGAFFCAEKLKPATWRIADGEILIDWKEFGRFVLTVKPGTKHLEGYALHQEDSKKWRKTLYFGALTPVEKLLIGDGYGTEWEFKGPDGDLTVEFRCDGQNHFVCQAIEG